MWTMVEIERKDYSLKNTENNCIGKLDYSLILGLTNANFHNNYMRFNGTNYFIFCT